MALVIARPWIDKIISGEKTWEIRNKTHPHAGERIALCKQRGPIVATCLIGAPIPLKRSECNKHFRKHRVRAAELRKIYPTGPLFAFPLSRIRVLKEPIAYKHPGGGSWVTLSPENVSEWKRLQRI